MKLRNKKTGEIIKDAQYRNYSTKDGFVITTPTDKYSYKSLKEFCEDWEDYNPTEPLIKDEEVRKAVRAWADANNINSRHYHENDVKFNSLEHELTWIDTSIQFNEFEALEGLEDGKRYTIAELCGEEEE